MRDFMVGLAFVASLGAFGLSWYTARKVRAIFHLINNRATRTVTVDMQDGKVTVIKEFKNGVVDAKPK